MKYAALLLLASQLLYASNPLLQPNNNQNIRNDAAYSRNEAFRAAGFGSKIIARDLFYKSCVLGDKLACIALSEINVKFNIDSILTNKDKCHFGDKDACFELYNYYLNEGILDHFKISWYLSKACKLGHKQACNISRNNNSINK